VSGEEVVQLQLKRQSRNDSLSYCRLSCRQGRGPRPRRQAQLPQSNDMSREDEQELHELNDREVGGSCPPQENCGLDSDIALHRK
jgi:hypothetical protein